MKPRSKSEDSNPGADRLPKSASAELRAAYARGRAYLAENNLFYPVIDPGVRRAMTRLGIYQIPSSKAEVPPQAHWQVTGEQGSEGATFELTTASSEKYGPAFLSKIMWLAYHAGMNAGEGRIREELKQLLGENPPL